MALTDTAVRNAKPKDKAYALVDSDALYLFVMPSGGKFWRYRFRWLGKQQTYSIGSYPQVSLSDARRERDHARSLVVKGQHPTQHRKQERDIRRRSLAVTLEAVSQEYLDSRGKKWDERYAARAKRFLENDVFPRIGRLPISDVTSAHLLDVLKRVEDRGSYSVAEKLRIWIGGVFRYAIATGRAKTDPTYALRGALHLPPTIHAAPLEKRRLPDLVCALNLAEKNEPMTAIGLKLLLLTFSRGSELRLARFAEVDLDDALWRVPEKNMKSRQPHVVPLSRQSVGLIQRLRMTTGESEFLFPSPTKRPEQPISDPVWRKALEGLGFYGEITPHGFRATASTLLNELGYNSDWIERQLAHAPRNRARASYNQAQYLPERRRMMQDYADHLDALCRTANVDGILNEK